MDYAFASSIRFLVGPDFMRKRQRLGAEPNRFVALSFIVLFVRRRNE
jgi:hypothetical protein